MDPFTALSVAAGVIQFIDFGTNVGRELRRMYNTGRVEQVEYFGNMAAELNDFTILLRRNLGMPWASENDRACSAALSLPEVS